MTERLSLSQARKQVLRSQRLPPTSPVGPAIDVTLSSIQHLGYIQIDTITAVQRAHHHTLWNRNLRYQPEQLDKLVETGEVFEYGSHAAAYLPMRDFRHSLVMKKRIADGDQNHWYVRDERLMKSVRKRIIADAPCHGTVDGSARRLLACPAKRAGSYTESVGPLPTTESVCQCKTLEFEAIVMI